MTITKKFYKKMKPLSLGRRLEIAGQLAWLLTGSAIADDKPFVVETEGWRFIVERKVAPPPT